MEKYYRILLDTSILLTPFELGIDLASEISRNIPGKHKLITITPVARELERKKGSLGKKLLDALGVEVIEYKGKNADEAILEFATEEKEVVVATNDIDLRNKLRKRRIPVLFVRGKQKLMLEGYVR